MRRVREFFGLKTNRIGQDDADETMKCKQRRVALDSCPQNLRLSFELESPDSADGDREGVRFHSCQILPNCFIVSRREFSEGIQRQVHFLSSSESHTWKVAWLYRNEAIFCFIGERKDKEIAWHDRHLYFKLIFRSNFSLICNRASALPRASSTGLCVCFVFLRCLKLANVSLTTPLYSEPRFVELWPKGFLPRKWWKYQLMNCQSKPLLSEMNMGWPLLTERIQSANCCMTAFGSSNCSVSSRVNPLTARASGIHLLGDRLQPAVERPVQGRLHDDGPEADHRIVAWDRAIGFDIDHDVGHRSPIFGS